MKNKKLNLNELKVKSFVTEFENGKENTVKGGATDRGCQSGPQRCFTEPTDPDPCGTHGCGTLYRSCNGGCAVYTDNCGGGGESMDISGPCAC